MTGILHQRDVNLCTDPHHDSLINSHYGKNAAIYIELWRGAPINFFLDIITFSIIKILIVPSNHMIKFYIFQTHFAFLLLLFFYCSFFFSSVFFRFRQYNLIESFVLCSVIHSHFKQRRKKHCALLCSSIFKRITHLYTVTQQY